MFKKSERLNRSEFTHYFAVGVKKHTKYFTTITSPATVLKVAVVVGKKVAKSAVKRNTMKRRVYAVLRKHLAGHQGVVIIVTKPTFAILPRKAAEAEITMMIAQVLKSA